MSSQHRRTKTSNYFPRPELSRKQEQLKSKRRRMSQGQMFDGLTTPELQEWVQLTGIMVEWCRNVRQPRRHWEDEERAALGEIARRENVDEPPVED